MKLSLDADVYSLDGHYGTLTHLIVNPGSSSVSHIAVKKSQSKKHPLVKIDSVNVSVPDCVVLDCDHRELDEMTEFIRAEFVRADPDRYFEKFRMDSYMDFLGKALSFPFVNLAAGSVIEHDVELIPYGELSVRRGTDVLDNQGKEVGTIDEFIVTEAEDKISHFIMREDHLFGDKEVTIPLSAIEKFSEDAVQLKLSSAEILELPHIRVKRWWE